MKRFDQQVNKAISLGLDPVKQYHDKRYTVDGFRIFRHDDSKLTVFDDITFWSKTRSGRVTLNLRTFITAPDIGFLDKLVGNWYYCEYVEKKCRYECCRDCGKDSGILLADYHRSKLANMPLDKMVEYIGDIN